MTSSQISIVDIDKDGIPEIVWGEHIYKITTTSGTFEATLWKTIENIPLTSKLTPFLTTIPADFDKDGNVDIFVYAIKQPYRI